MVSENKLKQLRSLSQKKNRLKRNRFIVEGVRLVEEATRAGRVESVFHSPDAVSSERLATLMTELKKRDIPVMEIEEKDLNSLSDTVQNQGVVALSTIPEHNDSQPAQINGNWLYLDQIRNPGNLGTILRTADWFHLKNIALSPATADPYNPKAVRGGMGAHFHLNIHTDWPLSDLKKSGRKIIAANQDSEHILKFNVKESEEWCLVIGSEADGISKENRNLADQFVSIPGTGEGDSLNVAVAAGILLYQLTNSS